jgi:uncharacterized repeat protein (TIGR01451 family)
MYVMKSLQGLPRLISASVGAPGKARNLPADIQCIQYLFNLIIPKMGFPLAENGKCDSQLVQCISQYQFRHLKYAHPDGVIDPTGRTFNSLIEEAVKVPVKAFPTMRIPSFLNAFGNGNGDAVQAADVILTLNLAGTAGIRVFKSPLLFDDVDASGYASAGDVLGYTFLIKNSNAQALATVNLVEPDPSLIDGPIVCEATTLVAGQPFALGSGTLASQDVARCAAAHTITAAEAQAGEALNLAEASGVPAIGPPVQGTGASAVGIPAAGQLVVTKTVNTPTTTVGDTVTYTVTVRNAGSTAIANVTISDPVPTGITTFAWACTGTGVACPAATGTGAITAAVPVFPAGAQLVYTVTALVAFGAPPTILNVVTVTPQTNVVCAPAATPPPCSATVPLGTGQVVEVPLGNPAILLTMAGLLGFAAASRLRRRVR